MDIHLFNKSNFWEEQLEPKMRAAKELIIISPYVKEKMLKKLESHIEERLEVLFITSDNFENAAANSLDISSLFEMSNRFRPKFKLYFHPKLHAKCYIFDRTSCYIGSANFTESGLGFSNSPNYESMVFIPKLSHRTKDDIENLIEHSDFLKDEIKPKDFKTISTGQKKIEAKNKEIKSKAESFGSLIKKILDTKIQPGEREVVSPHQLNSLKKIFVSGFEPKVSSLGSNLRHFYQLSSESNDSIINVKIKLNQTGTQDDKNLFYFSIKKETQRAIRRYSNLYVLNIIERKEFTRKILIPLHILEKILWYNSKDQNTDYFIEFRPGVESKDAKCVLRTFYYTTTLRRSDRNRYKLEYDITSFVKEDRSAKTVEDLKTTQRFSFARLQYDLPKDPKTKKKFLNWLETNKNGKPFL